MIFFIYFFLSGNGTKFTPAQAENMDWKEGKYFNFSLLVLFGSHFYQEVQTFLEVKVDINQIKLTPYQYLKSAPRRG